MHFNLKPPKSLILVRLSLVILLSISFAGCDKKPATEFKENTPAEAIKSNNTTDLTRQLALNYTNFNTAQVSLEQQIQQLTSIEKLSDLKLDLDVSIQVEGTQTAESQIRFTREEFLVPSKETIASNPQAFIDSINFRMNQILQPPYSNIQLIAQSSKIHRVPNQHYKIKKAEVSQIDFFNSEKSDETLVATDVNSNMAQFKNADGKVIENLSATFEFEYPTEYLELILNDAKPSIEFDEYTINFKRLAADQFQLKYPAEMKDSIIEILALHKNGKAIDRRKSSGNTLPDAASLSYLKLTNQHYQTTLKKLRSGNFASALELQTYIANNMPKEPEQMTSNVIDNITHYGPIEEIKLILQSKNTKTISKNGLINNDRIIDNQTGFYPAFDTKNKKYGLVDKLGKWQIQPSYNNLSFKFAEFFEDILNEQQYRLNKQNKILEVLDYRPRRKLSEKAILVDKVTTKSGEADGRPMRGVLELSTNQLIVPIEFYAIEMQGDYFIVEKNRSENLSSYLVFNSDGKSILPEGNYAEIKVENDFIYATTPLENTAPIRLVFDKNGKQITPNGWTAFEEFGDDNLLLLQRCKTVKDPNIDYTWQQCKKQFIDTKGNTAISLEKYDYADVSTFSNGYAAIVNKDNLMGYINTKGKLVIPFKYTSAGRFHKKYALVTNKKGDEMLIDANNRVFKNFKNRIKQRQYGYAEEDIYLMKDGSRYNGNGEKLPTVDKD